MVRTPGNRNGCQFLSEPIGTIGFNPEMQLKVDASGSEIGIDNINSAELRFVNHTKSMDIQDIEILISGEAKTASYYSYGDSRIAGGPHAGTSEAILQRPTGSNATGSVQVTGYRLIIEYNKATKPEQITQEDLAKLDTTKGQITVDIGNVNRDEGQSWTGYRPTTVAKIAPNLLRGKQILHFYRNKNGQLAISTSDPDADQADYFDYIQNVSISNGGTIINLDKIEVSIASLPKVEIDFSADVKKSIADLNINLGEITNALKSINQSIASIGDLMLNNQTTIPGYSLLIVQNHTDLTPDLEVTQTQTFNGQTIAASFRIAPAAQMQGYAAIKNGAWTLEGTLAGTSVKTQIAVPNQKYVHAYKTTSGGFKLITSEKDWLAARPADAMIEYGYVAVVNESNAKIKDLYFVRKTGDINQIGVSGSVQGMIQNVSPGGSTSSIGSGQQVELGNYLLFAKLDNERMLFQGEGKDFFVAIPAGKDTSGFANVVKITQQNVNEALPPQIRPIAFTNGGPPFLPSEEGYDTTLLSISLDAPSTVYNITYVSGSSSIGNLIRIDDQTYEATVIPNSSETYRFRVNGDNVSNEILSVNIYKKSSPPASSFVPVTDVVVLNGEDFVKGQSKKINATVVPEGPNGATNQQITWTIGTADYLNFNSMHFYGLGSNADLNTDTSGYFTVKTSWGYNYWYVAAIVQNGIAEGTRHPDYHSVGATVVDQTGNRIDITMQALVYDNTKDFVKVFRFNQYTPPNVPSHIFVRFVNEDDGYNPGMTRLIFYKIDKDVDIGNNKQTANGHPYGLDFWVYDGSGDHLTRENKTLDNVMAKIRYPTNGKNGPSIVESAHRQDYVSSLPVKNVDLAQYSSVHPLNDANSIIVTESCVLEFDRPMNRERGTPHFVGLPSGLNIRLETIDGSKPANWLIAWIGSNQYRTQSHSSVKPEDEYKGYWPSSQTANSSRYWTRGGSPSESHKWFILPATVRGMKSGDSVTVYAKQWGIKY